MRKLIKKLFEPKTEISILENICWILKQPFTIPDNQVNSLDEIVKIICEKDVVKSLCELLVLKLEGGKEISKLVVRILEYLREEKEK